MDPTSPLTIRDPKGGSGGGKGFKTSGSYYGGGGGSGGGHLPLWADLVIIFGVIWVVVYASLLIFFLRRAPKNNTHRKTTGATIAYAAWRAFKWATLLGVVIWAVQKVAERAKTSCEGRKNVGGTFYRKVGEEERGVKDGSESVETIWSRGPTEPPPSYTPL
ncbi:hypothetical protein GGR53DRAFT_463768 [Hypoxylon sp. FL1150]|nr:hypothetical protein GGR53DRAFT_463768 [Hypoxylon sp. FL1150]